MLPVFFCPQVRSEFSLKAHAKLDAMVKGINQIIPLAQGTMTGLAIKYVMNAAFTAEEGDRPKVTQFYTSKLKMIHFKVKDQTGSSF